MEERACRAWSCPGLERAVNPAEKEEGPGPLPCRCLSCIVISSPVLLVVTSTNPVVVEVEVVAHESWG